MKSLLAALLLVACAGPGTHRLAETPTATTKARPAEAPAASDSDKDREHVVKSFDSMTDAKNAQSEADQSAKSQPAPTAPGQAPAGGATTVKPTKKPASPENKE